MPNITKHIFCFVFTLFISGAICATPLAAGDKNESTKPEEKSEKSSKSAAQLNAPKTRSNSVRTLDAITIEGEIAVPQVLFITSRDYRRYRDGLGLKFRMTTTEVARSLDLPTHLRIVAKPKEENK